MGESVCPACGQPVRARIVRRPPAHLTVTPQQLRERYEAGATVAELARAEGCRNVFISDLLREAGVTLHAGRRKGSGSKEETT